MYIHVYTSTSAVKLQLARWGNSLAVRLPVNCTRAAGLREGDALEAQVGADGTITLTPARPFDRRAFVRLARRRLAGMTVTPPVVEAMRRHGRY